MLAIFKTPKTGRSPDQDDPARSERSYGQKPSGTPSQMPVPEHPNIQEPTKGYTTPAREFELKPSQTSTTTIGKNLVFKGEVSGEGSIRIEGKCVGTINVGQEVIIGNGGSVEGNIKAKNVSVVGNLHGNVNAIDKITIDVSGIMLGDIVAPRVVVAEGAVYKGRIDMEPKSVKSSEKNQDRKETLPQVESATKEPQAKSPTETKIPGPPPKA